MNIILVLGLAIWIIYLTDHLLDSARAGNSFSTTKYGFYHKYRKYLSCLLLILFATGLAMVIVTLSSDTIIAGLAVGGFVFLYLSGQHLLGGSMRKFFPKEIIITVIYIAAIWIIPLLRKGTADVKYLPYLALHILMVITNVSLFSMFEKSEDVNSHKDSFFEAISDQQLKTIILILAAAGLTGSLLLLQKGGYLVLPFIVISVVYILEAVFSQRGFIARYYGEITDGVFLLFLLFFIPNFSV
jgi:hypothetical protein